MEPAHVTWREILKIPLAIDFGNDTQFRIFDPQILAQPNCSIPNSTLES
ncbi:hypothetical protein DB31_5772 [Hyalangium minutum]|uniref:Uncharacterized protein n=1 Tax=Hyalangium minutum TaxID=394096 RepID=A0A085WSR7_9BACT|nr:hypothetical protein DB31_5772 [Hyalangium minutum]